ncbi:MAG: HD domain-containing protein [Dehalococcoidales bacterium]|nr:HD domain-containing protein [Dehalococcoidales bacterium]
MRRLPARIKPIRVKAGQVLKMPGLQRRMAQVRTGGVARAIPPKPVARVMPSEKAAPGNITVAQPDIMSRPDSVITQKEKYGDNGGDKALTPVKLPSQAGVSKVALLEKLWARVKPEDKEDELITCIMRMTHDAVNSSASSLLLLDDNTQELYFKFADGPVGQQLKRLHISRQSGIAGWIVRNARPLVVNDAEKNANFYKLIDNATGFKTKSIIGVPIIIGEKVIGVIEVLNKADGAQYTKKDLRIMLGVAATIGMTIETTRMNANLLHSYRGTVGALVSLADTKESSGGGHSRRVTEYSLTGARELSFSKEEKQNLEYAAILHDIGKLSIPDSVLNKTGDLTEEEWEMIREHPAIGYNLLKEIPFLKEASRLILCHHERYDGKGYPQGIKGEAIPMGARLIAVADAFDYMTTEHNHRPAMSRQQAFAELHRHARTQFCPAAVKAFNSGFVRTRLSKK